MPTKLKAEMPSPAAALHMPPTPVTQMLAKLKAKMTSLAAALHMPPTPVTHMPTKLKAEKTSLAAALHMPTKGYAALTKMPSLAQMAATNMQVL